MLVVGLTGGIASGKSTVSDHLKNLGVPVYDTDEISRQLMHPGQAAYLQAVDHFGTEILNEDQTINRKFLRQIVFDQAHEKQWLESMIHPLIFERSQQAVKNAGNSDYVVLVVPLMFETGFEKLVDYVVAIDCPNTVQLSRLMKRDEISETLAMSMIRSQLDNDERLSRADLCIENSGNNDLFTEIQHLHDKLTLLARK